jgi:hypothetical protein
MITWNMWFYCVYNDIYILYTFRCSLPKFFLGPPNHTKKRPFQYWNTWWLGDPPFRKPMETPIYSHNIIYTIYI